VIDEKVWNLHAEYEQRSLERDELLTDVKVTDLFKFVAIFSICLVKCFGGS